MKSVILVILSIIDFRILTAQDFAYMDHVSLFKYLEEPRGGLALFPVPGNKEVLQKWLADKEALTSKLKRNEIKGSDIEKNAGLILNSKNYLGFIHFSSAIANTGRELEVFKIYKSLLTDNPKHNFCILYGLYVIKQFATKETSKLLAEPTKDIVLHIKNSGLKVEKTNRYPDLLLTLGK